MIAEKVFETSGTFENPTAILDQVNRVRATQLSNYQSEAIYPLLFLCCYAASYYVCAVPLQCLLYLLGSGYFAVDSNLPSETILP